MSDVFDYPYQNLHRFNSGHDAVEAFRKEALTKNPDATFFAWMLEFADKEKLAEIKQRPMHVKLWNCNRCFKNEDEIFEAWNKEELSKPQADQRWIVDWYFSEIDCEDDVGDESSPGQ